MLISEFSRRAGLTSDTVRFYVRLGLLRPKQGTKGGQRPYQVFDAEHLQEALIIRTAQSLGMSLKEIAAISAARRAGQMTRDRSVAVLETQLERLQTKAAELEAMQGYLAAKSAWLRGGEKGAGPDFRVFAKAA